MTVTLVHTKNKKIFGGFTEATWDISNSYKKGNKGFIFSVNNNMIYYNKNSEYNIFCRKDLGPVFGDFDLIISNNCNNNYDSHDYTNKITAYDTPGDTYVLAEDSKFSILDYAIYQIEID